MSLVLIAEDEPAVLEVLCEVIEGLGHEVVRAHDGAEALTLARERRPSLVISDHMMPRLSGVELLRTIRRDAALQHIPVLLMSATKPDGHGEADGFLSKPFDLDAIERAIQALIQRRHPAAADATRPSSTPGADREELLRWISHEIKTPLAAAKTHLQLLQRQRDLNDAHGRNHLDVATRQLDKIHGLVNAFLDAARLSSGALAVRPAPCDAAEFVRTVVAEWRVVEPAHQFVVQAPDRPVIASLDGERVRQVLDKLISNALKYAGAGPVEVELAPAGERIAITVADRGPGVAPEDLPKLFQPFRSTGDAEGKSHGLGLYIAGELARLHGGDLTGRTRPGGGALFVLTLPRAPADSPR